VEAEVEAEEEDDGAQRAAGRSVLLGGGRGRTGPGMPRLPSEHKKGKRTREGRKARCR
jgi:hypothetical protein